MKQNDWTIVDGAAVYSTHTMAYCGGMWRPRTDNLWDNMEMPEMPQGWWDVKEPTERYSTVFQNSPLKWIQKHVITIFAGLVTFSMGGVLYRLYRRYMAIHGYIHGYTWLYIAIHGYIHGYTWLYMAIHGYTLHYTILHHRHVRSEVSRWWSVAAAEDTERTGSRSELRRTAMALLQRAGEPVDQGSFVGPWEWTSLDAIWLFNIAMERSTIFNR